MKEMTEKEALLKLTAVCSQAEHCTYEMLEKMRRWDIADDAQARIMEYLVKEKFVDDERYCRFFVRDKIRYNKWGRRKVEQALMQKRMDRTTYEPVLDEVDDATYLNVLIPLLKNKRRQLKAMSDYEANGRLIRFALSRGFTMDIIRQCLDHADEYIEDGAED